MSIPLQPAIVYGPLRSRRFGSSLGINLLPLDHKLCNFQCVYCQYGAGAEGGAEPPGLEDIAQACRTAFQNARGDWESRPDWVMFSGNGEPTLHPDFPQVVETVVQLRDELIPDVPIGILSNGSTCWREPVREALLKLDGRFMKLDAGSAEVFGRINGPVSAGIWEQVLRGLQGLPRITIQSLFVRGSIDNTSEEAVRRWVEVVGHIAPESVQIYTLDRPAAVGGLLPVPSQELESIAARLYARTHSLVRVFWPEPFDPKPVE